MNTMIRTLNIPMAGLSLSGAEDGPGFFKFLELPAELRNKIYAIHLIENNPCTVDLEPDNAKRIAPRLNLLLTCRRIHAEAYPIFYGHYTFRIFPIHGCFYKSKSPLLARLPSRYRAAITSLELRLGPGWSDPPKSWAVTERLGLRDATAVRMVKVFVECDPSHESFKGFRKNADFYTDFSGNLLKNIMDLLPKLEAVQFDGFPSVNKASKLMTRLVLEVEQAGKNVLWSSTKDWDAPPYEEGQYGW